MFLAYNNFSRIKKKISLLFLHNNFSYDFIKNYIFLNS